MHGTAVASEGSAAPGHHTACASFASSQQTVSTTLGAAPSFRKAAKAPAEASRVTTSSEWVSGLGFAFSASSAFCFLARLARPSLELVSNRPVVTSPRRISPRHHMTSRLLETSSKFACQRIVGHASRPSGMIAAKAYANGPEKICGTGGLKPAFSSMVRPCVLLSRLTRALTTSPCFRPSSLTRSASSRGSPAQNVDHHVLRLLRLLRMWGTTQAPGLKKTPGPRGFYAVGPLNVICI